ncbi:MAG: selenide, water dikinase SelD, partial [Candidatus Marinimicrobia bacterium]|nr:selenide, water dikinase SelD [Candidatus Neomarinimicrobiota bacterium]
CVSFDDQLDETQKLLTADAQTSGGLLISLPMDDARSFIKKMDGFPRIIGQITDRQPHLIKVQ